MMELKKGTRVRVTDPDGLGTTDAMVLSVEGESYVSVKFCSAVWNLNTNIMVRRKGSTATIHRSRIAQ